MGHWPHVSGAGNDSSFRLSTTTQQLRILVSHLELLSTMNLKKSPTRSQPIMTTKAGSVESNNDHLEPKLSPTAVSPYYVTSDLKHGKRYAPDHF